MSGHIESFPRWLLLRADSATQNFGALFESRTDAAAIGRNKIFWLLVILLTAAIVRFWGVGAFSLHKPDEDTTALAAVHILQDGAPRFPSGMFYARAIVQSYLIAASVELFGRNEWALRLPSVLCGIAVVVLSFWMSRRFLSRGWALALAGCVALLPGMITDSQEVRMYIFLVASLAAYAALIFEWEQRDRIGYLIAAVLTMLVGIQFQQLAIFGSLLMLFPGIARRSIRRLLTGGFALGVIGVGYIAISHWIGSFYPQAAATGYATALPQLGEAPASAPIAQRLLWGLAGGAIGILAAWPMTRGFRSRRMAITVQVLLVLGLLAQGAIAYHLAMLVIAAALLLARRQARLSRTGLLILLLGSLTLACAHIVLLHADGVSSARKMLGVLVGRPSVWQYVTLGRYSASASAIVLAGILEAGWRLAHRRPISDVWLFFLLAVWLPLLAMGLFGWYFPPRYTEFALLPLLVTAMACCQQWLRSSAAGAAITRGWVGAAALIGVCMVIVNPLAVAKAVNSGPSYPDHRAEARFMRALHPGPKDIVIAEEVLMQTYYLGHIDYWLQDPAFAASFVIRVHGQIVDEYTDTPVIGTVEQLRQLVDRRDRGALYIIGSGENFDHGFRPMRGKELSRYLESAPFHVIYAAGDGVTKIWEVSAPSHQ